MSSKVSVQATVIGWLKDDAVMKDVGNGYSVCKFCVKAQKYNRETKEKDTVFIDCDLWGKKAETLRPMLRAGKYVQVQGTIDSFKYVTVNVSDITLLQQQQDKEQQTDSPPPPIDSHPNPEDLF